MSQDQDAIAGDRRPYDQRATAIQAELVAIEEHYGRVWIETVRGLASEQLPMDEFTEKRMLLLKLSLKDRKRAMAKLRWKFDPNGRRRPDLVERDIARTLAWARKVVDEYKAEASQAKQEPADDPVRKARTVNRVAIKQRTDPSERLVDLAASILGETTPVPVEAPRQAVRSLDGVKPGSIAMVSGDTGIEDLATATDEDIINAYMARTGITRDIAEQYLALLQPDH